MHRIVGALFVLLACVGAASAQSGGDSEAAVASGGTSIKVLLYRPQCANPSLLIVFHGLHRNVESARNAARPVADKLCMLVVAPLFDTERFPSWSYQRGGLVYRRGQQPRDQWTVNWVPRIVAWANQMERRPLPVTLMGHSAGAQFLSRVAAYSNVGARHMIVANPSTHVMASAQTAAPFGFAGVFANTEAELRAYLAKPVVIALGEEDTGDENLNESADAMAQGANRLERGRNAYAMAERLARARGWNFAWKLVIVPGVAHSARSIYNSAEVMRVLTP